MTERGLTAHAINSKFSSKAAAATPAAYELHATAAIHES